MDHVSGVAFRVLSPAERERPRWTAWAAGCTVMPRGSLRHRRSAYPDHVRGKVIDSDCFVLIR